MEITLSFFTANSFEDIRRLSEFDIDYIGLGPFRYTKTKEKLEEILGIEGYIRFIEKCRQENINIPIIAIGGIKSVDIEELMMTGVYGIAMSSCITISTDKINEIRKIISKIYQI